MSGDNVEDQFKQFLADNKIDVSALKGTKEEQRFFKEVEDQRVVGITKAVSIIIDIMKNLFIALGQLSLHKLRAVSSAFGHPWLHERGRRAGYVGDRGVYRR